MKPEIIIAYETPLIIVLHYLEIKKKNNMKDCCGRIIALYMIHYKSTGWVFESLHTVYTRHPVTCAPQRN